MEFENYMGSKAKCDGEVDLKIMAERGVNVICYASRFYQNLEATNRLFFN